MKLRVLVVDDIAVARKVITEVLGTGEGFVVLGQATNGFEAIRELGEAHPDVIVLDHQMPGLTGLTFPAHAPLSWTSRFASASGSRRSSIVARMQSIFEKPSPRSDRMISSQRDPSSHISAARSVTSPVMSGPESLRVRGPG